MTFQPSSIWDPTFVLPTQMSFTNKCQPLTYIIHTALRYISSAASGQKNLSRRNIYKLMILTLVTKLCCPVLCKRECLQFMCF